MDELIDTSIFDPTLTFPKDVLLELSSSYSSSTPVKQSVPKREIKAAEKAAEKQIEDSAQMPPAKTIAPKRNRKSTKSNKSFEIPKPNSSILLSVESGKPGDAIDVDMIDT